MAGFTLVHGSTQNGTAWAAVAEQLRTQGHSVSIPELPKNEASWPLSRYADFIDRAVPESRPRLIVAHSFSGVFLPLLASCRGIINARFSVRWLAEAAVERETLRGRYHGIQPTALGAILARACCVQPGRLHSVGTSNERW